jgi:hypothetical protein
MPGKESKGTPDESKAPADSAISQIAQMNPRRVTVTLPLPIPGTRNKPPIVTLEWSREDTTLPLSELLQRIETYVAQYGSK